ncbi:MAG: hypothetical protein KZQ77_19430 [Candidatus Thiodiazotropha sp. (ex Notomyrtea botanica)]|nr:hypothetical protein [Candidatus Thiodiazotropha sp. (ex Notomyrtea botanica)]
MKMSNGMNSIDTILSYPRVASGMIAGLLVISAGLAQAAPGSISQSPLFLTQAVQPNIFFMLDDSGSMDWEVLKTAGAIAAHGTGSNSGNFDFDPGSDTTNNREHCAGYNAMAYDPDNTYTTWAGEDYAGNEFQDQSVTNAMVNPYTGHTNTSSCDDSGNVYNYNGRTCNLLTDFNDGRVSGKAGAFYYVWDDSNNDGVYQSGECSTSDSDRVYVQDLTAEQQTNYANWFSYYRKREYVMKRAVSEIISDSAERMGIGTINRNNHITKGTEVGTQVEDIDDITLPVNATAAADKVTLVDNLLGINSSSGTPLRLGLENTGKYFMNQMTNSALFGYTPSSQTSSAAGHSPILSTDLGGTCQQNFAIVMSDGFWNGGDPSVGNTDTDGTGDYDGQSYADSVSNTLADVAMHYYETDLLSIADEVPVVSIDVVPGDEAECNAVVSEDAHLHPNCYDTNTQQHLVTYTVAFGVRGTIPEFDGSGNECEPNTRATSVASQNWPTSCDSSLTSGWPTPSANSSRTVDDMMHAAWNGRGQFLSAKDPQQLIDTLQEAIEDISSRSEVAAAAVAVDTFNVTGGGNVVQGKFDSGAWTGELFSYEILVSVNNEISVSTTPQWAAHDLLDARAYTSRLAVTYNGTQGIAFDFPSDYTSLAASDLSQDQIDDLLFDAPYSISTSDTAEITANQTYGENLVAFLQGDHGNEETSTNTSGIFRDREGHKLGDIINSAPVYVGDPDTDFSDTTSYQSWANSLTPTGAKGRREMVYIGANDGALHAIDATTGEEVFAYFPKAVFRDDQRWGLHWLADRFYEHRYYVDGEITVSEVYADIDGTGTKWNTILIGTLRAGGRSIFAIDISDPSEFSTEAGVASNILWEFSHDELGFTFGKPTIAEMNNGRWAAIFGNGYNPGETTSTGEASLFIKYLDSPTDFERLSTGSGSNTAGDCLDASSDCNGLSTPAVVDLGADSVADRVYAGDIQGNLWVFDISSTSTSSWGIPSGFSGNPLITAMTAGAAEQPITSQPIVILHPTERHSNTSPNTMVYFGTGQYLAENDPVSTQGNTFYGVWDDGTPITVARDSVLVEQTVNQTTLGSADVRLLTNNPVDYTTDRGWYFDLPESGERIVTNPIVFGDLVVYNSITPESNLCSTSGGTSWLMVHNLLDGSEPDFIAIDVTNNGVFDSGDQVGDANVAGVRSGNLNWQMTLAKSGPGAEAIAIVPSADIDTYNIRGGRSVGTRSSWGRYRIED